MSSFDFLPSWLITWHKTNMFTDSAAVEAEARLVRAVYDALADVPRFKGITLGNECNQFTDASHPGRMVASSEQIGTWLRALIDPIEADAAKRGQTVVHSENDAVWYEDGHAFTPVMVGGIGDESVIHSWVFNGTAQRYGALSEESTRHAEYLIELSKAFADDSGRLVWLQEIGAPGNVIDEADAPLFCRRSVEHAADCTGVSAVTWWCSHDVDESMGDFPPFEHHLGLFDVRGHVKPIGREFSRLAGRFRNASDPQRRDDAIVVEVGEDGNPTLREACAPGGSVFSKWMEMSAAGMRPAIVSSKQSADRTLLKERGIERCISVDMKAGMAYNAVSDPSLSAAQTA